MSEGSHTTLLGASGPFGVVAIPVLPPPGFVLGRSSIPLRVRHSSDLLRIDEGARVGLPDRRLLSVVVVVAVTSYFPTVDGSGLLRDGG